MFAYYVQPSRSFYSVAELEVLFLDQLYYDFFSIAGLLQMLLLLPALMLCRTL
jgi:hypothetical protein